MENNKILVIEDNGLNMKLFRSLLRLESFTVLEAEDAEKGIKLARGGPPGHHSDGHSIAGDGRFGGNADHERKPIA